MSVTQQDRDFLTDHHSAAMITVGRDGTPKVSRVGVALVDGKLWSSGTADRVRTGRLRRDPRCTLYVYDPGYAWLALETSVTILDGPDAAALNLRLFRVMQARPNGPLSWFGGELGEEDFLRAMVDEGRLIYEFEVHHTYGMQ
jgi:PPOX class probable F420-dependent enzyme